MATINSHRKGQVYSEVRSPGYFVSQGGVPKKQTLGIMPGKYYRSDNYYSGQQDFNTLGRAIHSGFLGANKEPIYNYARAGLMNHNTVLYSFNPSGTVSMLDSRSIFAVDLGDRNYSTNIYQIMNYSRKQTGVINNGHTSYKRVREADGSSGYKYVLPISEYIGGNIKSRQATLKWIGGMWRAK